MSMKAWSAPRAFALGSVLVLASCGAPQPAPQEEAPTAQQRAAQSAALADEFQGELQAALAAAMAEGGPVAAIAVCESSAPAIPEALSVRSGAQITRVAARRRNPGAGVPDEVAGLYRELERAPLAQDGTPRAVHRASDGGFVYLRAIPMQEQPCAACHGTAIDPQVAAAIEQAYPDDLATGFRPGELRGAFLVQWAP
jgi:hypothetical protein